MVPFAFSLLERVYQTPSIKAKALDPYSDNNEAPFYRQPAGIRKQKKNEQKEEAGECMIQILFFYLDNLMSLHFQNRLVNDMMTVI
jgi:hypothetical protein